jgi:hypothetical protein
MYRKTMTVLACLIGSGATAEQTYSDLATAANSVMDQVNLSRTLATGASYYAGVGGIAPDGSVTQAQLDAVIVDAYNDAYNTVLNTTYYNTETLLQDQHDTAMTNLSASVDALVAATTTFATVGAVAEMAAEASAGTVQDQEQVQEILATTDMTISDADVAEYNEALADVEKYAQEAAGFLAASMDTRITDTTDNWAANNNVSVATYTSVTYDATSDVLFLEFANQTYTSISFQGYLTGSFKTADDIYNTGIAYGG